MKYQNNTGAEPNSSDDILKTMDHESMHRTPIMECDDKVAAIHEKEVEIIFDRLYKASLFQSSLAVSEKYIDTAHKDKLMHYYLLNGMDELDDHMYYYDFKNGCDLGISKEGSLIIALYGSSYEYRKIFDYTKVLLCIDPVEESGTYGEITKQRYDSLVRRDARTQLHSIKPAVEKKLKQICKENHKEYEKRR